MTAGENGNVRDLGSLRWGIMGAGRVCHDFVQVRYSCLGF